MLCSAVLFNLYTVRHAVFLVIGKATWPVSLSTMLRKAVFSAVRWSPDSPCGAPLCVMSLSPAAVMGAQAVHTVCMLYILTKEGSLGLQVSCLRCSHCEGNLGGSAETHQRS